MPPGRDDAKRPPNRGAAPRIGGGGRTVRWGSRWERGAASRGSPGRLGDRREGWAKEERKGKRAGCWRRDRVTRSTQTREVWLVGLDELVLPEEIVDALASSGGCGPGDVQLGHNKYG